MWAKMKTVVFKASNLSVLKISGFGGLAVSDGRNEH